MSAPRSPTGKRLGRPIVGSWLTSARHSLEDPHRELYDAISADVRQLIRCLVLWIAFLLILYLHTVNLD